MKIHVVKNEDAELPVPSIWRKNLGAIANSFVLNNFPSVDAAVDLAEYRAGIIVINFDNISDYPETLGLLSEQSWETSIYRWMDGYWEVLVDLSNDKGETSDLVLHLKVYEYGTNYKFEPDLIYVP